MPPIPHTAMGLSSPSSGIILAGLVVASFLYVRGWRGVRAASASAIPTWWLAPFLVGMFLVWGALGPPLVAYDPDLLQAHMLQHLLSVTFPPPHIPLT